MTKERLIWRPNEFTPKEWDRLSREEQIQWWKDNAPRAKPPPHPLRAVTLYDEGGITGSEIPFFVFERLTEDNVKELMADCSPAVLEILQTQAEQLPADDDDGGWENVKIARWSTSAHWVPVEDIRQAEAESNRRYREGVRLFRDNLSSP